ncbi:MAG: hypothetical protein KR126chlam2_00959 [Chlamydiae bacterium]|nr:hypothetical protein [Chlamydiota bacterium]
MNSILNNVTSQTSQATPKDSSTEVNGYYALLIALEGTTKALQGTAVVQIITTQNLIKDENTINTQQAKDTFDQISWAMTHGTVSDDHFMGDWSDKSEWKKNADGNWVATDGDIYTPAEVTADLTKYINDLNTAGEQARKKYPKWFQKRKRQKYIDSYMAGRSVEITKTPSSADLHNISNNNLRIQAQRDYLTGMIKIDTNIGQVLSANASSTASALTQAIDNFSSDLQTMTQIIQSIFKN